MRWLHSLNDRAEEHRDVRALGEVYKYTSDVLLGQGDLASAIHTASRGRELCARIGDNKVEGWCLAILGQVYLGLGELSQAEEHLQKALETMVGDKSDIAAAYLDLGAVACCRGAWERAMAALQEAGALYREVGSSRQGRAACAAGRVLMAQGDRRRAVTEFQEAIAHAKRDPIGLVAALGGLEEACDDASEFQDHRERLHREWRGSEDPAAPSPTRWLQWALEPAEPDSRSSHPFVEPFRFGDRLPPGWDWLDPAGDSRWSLRAGLEIRVANGRDLRSINLSAPRLLRPAAGDLDVETTCEPVVGDSPAIGGLLLWKDAQNYLRLDRGSGGRHEITFLGCVENHDAIFGRGRLPSEPTYLRLERRDRHIRALCSADGRAWFSVGQIEFHPDDPLAVGLYAAGRVDRILYPAAHREGAAIRFTSFCLGLAFPG
jgi:tetratricopeptide (TPR) repeat protein